MHNGLCAQHDVLTWRKLLLELLGCEPVLIFLPHMTILKSATVVVPLVNPAAAAAAAASSSRSSTGQLLSLTEVHVTKAVARTEFLPV
jgi:hypothetical protein